MAARSVHPTINMAADYMRAKLTSFTEVVFPNRPTQERRQHHLIRPGNELMSSLSLQMTLYFNVFFFPFWIVTCIVMLELKFAHLENIYRFVVITVYVVMSGVEIVRLYLGYLGNLQERVPEVAGFWLLTIVLQLPLIVFLLATNKALPSPLERAVHFVQLTFLLFEAVTGYFALRRMAHHQIMKFHLHQFDEIFDIDNGQAATDKYQPMT